MQVPFVVYLKIEPFRGQRFEYVHSMQSIASRILEALETISGLTLAQPGGGQQDSSSGIEQSAFSTLTNGCMVRPQFGNAPPLVAIAGFHTLSGAVQPSHPEHLLISGGAWHTGARQHLQDSNPTTIYSAGAKGLVTAIEAAITTEFPGLSFAFHEIDYAGVIYGAGGVYLAI